jgi:hypothetical protein
MPFSKRFPRTEKGYTVWDEVFLTEAEEDAVEAQSRAQNIELMKRCLHDAEQLVKEKGMKDFQSNVVSIAIALFEKQASHSVYWKENLTKEKFDKKNQRLPKE